MASNFLSTLFVTASRPRLFRPIPNFAVGTAISRSLSGYNFFVREQAKINPMTPGESLSDFAKRVSIKYRTLSETEREDYRRRAKEYCDRTLDERVAVTAAKRRFDTSRRRELVKQYLKKLGVPSRPQNLFVFFCSTLSRQELLLQNMDMKTASNLVAKKYRALDGEELERLKEKHQEYLKHYEIKRKAFLEKVERLPLEIQRFIGHAKKDVGEKSIGKGKNRSKRSQSRQESHCRQLSVELRNLLKQRNQLVSKRKVLEVKFLSLSDREMMKVKRAEKKYALVEQNFKKIEKQANANLKVLTEVLEGKKRLYT